MSGVQSSDSIVNGSEIFTLSSDHDPLRIDFINGRRIFGCFGVTEIKPVPHVPMPHPFVERLIGTIRREYQTSRCSDSCIFVIEAIGVQGLLRNL